MSEQLPEVEAKEAKKFKRAESESDIPERQFKKSKLDQPLSPVSQSLGGLFQSVQDNKQLPGSDNIDQAVSVLAMLLSPDYYGEISPKYVEALGGDPNDEEYWEMEITKEEFSPPLNPHIGSCFRKYDGSKQLLTQIAADDIAQIFAKFKGDGLVSLLERLKEKLPMNELLFFRGKPLEVVLTHEAGIDVYSPTFFALHKLGYPLGTHDGDSDYCVQTILEEIRDQEEQTPGVKAEIARLFTILPPIPESLRPPSPAPSPGTP